MADSCQSLCYTYQDNGIYLTFSFQDLGPSFISPIEDEHSKKVSGLIKKLNIAPDYKKKGKILKCNVPFSLCLFNFLPVLLVHL